MKHVKKHKDVPKTIEEKVLFETYNDKIKNSNDPISLNLLAIQFKEDLKVFLVKRKKYRYAMAILLFTCLSFSQNSIVASGSSNMTIGEIFPIMQTIQEEKEVTLSTPKFEIPIEQPKPIIKKKPKSFFEKLIEFFKNLINKNK